MKRLRALLHKGIAFITERLGKRETHYSRVERDWLTALLVFAVLVLALLAASAALFFSVANEGGTLVEQETGAGPNTINRSRLTDLIEELELREETYRVLQERAPDIADPSIGGE